MKKIFSILIALTLVIASLASYWVHAEDTEESDGTESAISVDSLRSRLPMKDVTLDTYTTEEGFQITERPQYDLSGLSPENIFELPASVQTFQSAAIAEDLEADAPDVDAPDFSLATATDYSNESMEVYSSDGSLVDSRAARTARATRAGSVERYDYDGYLTQVGAQASVYPVWLQHGDIMQVSVDVPHNLTLDYDLIVWQFDLNTGMTMPDPVGYSVYDTTSEFMNETTGVINNTGAEAAYAVSVVSTVGSSQLESFHLAFTIDSTGTFDNYETDDNAFWAVEIPDLQDGSLTLNVPARNINATLDSDWFYVYVPNDKYSGISFDLSVSGNIGIESYAVSSGTGLVKTGDYDESKSLLPVVQGANYIRIFDNGNTSFPVEYEMSIYAKLKATKAVSYISVNGYCQRYSDNFNNGVYRGLILSGSQVSHIVHYVDASNRPGNVESDTVSIRITNPSWGSNTSQSDISDSSSVENADYGSVTIKAGATSVYPGYNNISTTAKSGMFGTLYSESNALINYYNNGELSKPCEHYGSCGLN